MRSDMAKVIVERPRYGSRTLAKKKGYSKYLQKTPIDEMPLRESMLGRWQGMDKFLNEHLGPMRRFLRSNIGRPWNKVHQELCEHVSFDNAVQGHVLEHIYQYVHKHVDVQDSLTVIERSCRGGSPRRLREGEMYVCPNSGLLKQVRKNRREKLLDRVKVNSHTFLIRKGQQWWEVRLRDRPKGADEVWDVWLERDVRKLTKSNRVSYWGYDFIAVSKRPLTRSETQELYRKLKAKTR